MILRRVALSAGVAVAGVAIGSATIVLAVMIQWAAFWLSSANGL